VLLTKLSQRFATLSDPLPPPQEDLEDLFEHAPCGYLSIEPGGTIFKANATFCEWTGFAAAELVGRRFSDLLNIAGRIYYETHFAPLLRMQGFFNEVALELVVSGDARLPVLVNAVERRAEDGSPLFVRITVFNATDRRQYERELLQARSAADQANAALRALNAELEGRIAAEVAERMKTEELIRQAQRMEAIGQLTGGVAHDFNNLLTIIMGGVDAIQRQATALPVSHQSRRISRSAEMAMHGARRAATLVARLLAFSRRQPLAPKPLDINALLAGIGDLLHRTLGETIALEIVAGAGLWDAMADAAELENVLINLAVNARDAMPAGGRLTIETANAFLDEGYVAALAEPVSPGQYVLIAVSDTGHGMDQATLEKVFEPFFTTKEVGKGTGLGLSQVYGFVRQTGGHVRMYSELGEGTTVKLYLPRSVSASKAEGAPSSGATRSDGGPETVLVVEDDKDLRAYSVATLRELGYTVLEAENGKAALAALEGRKVDLLFTDVVLPGGMNGRTLADEAKRRCAGLRVLFTTGYTRNAIIHHDRLDAGVDLLGKPFTFEDLARKVRQVLDR
jgi:PAS domain S-box-containing protein